MNYTLKDMLDVDKLQELMDSLDQVNTLPSAVIDIEGNILTATAWQDICTKFHRINPDTEKKCIESDMHIEARLAEKTANVIYRCHMGLVDSATPIIIDGKHLGNVFTGQVFMEPPDEAYFIEQARLYGFNETEYLAAMRKVPLIHEEHLHKNQKFISKLVQMLAEQGVQHKRQLKAEASLRESEATFRHMFEDADDPVLLIKDGCFTDCNTATLRLLGYASKSRLLDRSPSEISPAIQPDGRFSEEKAAEIIASALHVGDQRFEWLHTRADGSLLQVEVTLTPITVGGEVILHTHWRDITERKQLEEEVKQSLEAANSTNSTMDRLLKTLSHEFRSPLGVLICGTDFLDRYWDRLPYEQLFEHNKLIQKAAYQLTTLLNSAISFNQLGNDRFWGPPQLLDVGEICSVIAAEVEEIWNTGHEFNITIATDCGTALLDKFLFRRVLENLMTNAFRYTPTDGNVFLKVYRENNLLYLEISDTGIGIPEEDYKMIFEAFYRCPNVGVPRGLGLGLSIVHEALQQMGGTIAVTSRIGEGTTMKVEIPICTRS